jgi:hypothetical protein
MEGMVVDVLCDACVAVSVFRLSVFRSFVVS